MTEQLHSGHCQALSLVAEQVYSPQIHLLRWWCHPWAAPKDLEERRGKAHWVQSSSLPAPGTLACHTCCVLHLLSSLMIPSKELNWVEGGWDWKGWWLPFFLPAWPRWTLELWQWHQSSPCGSGGPGKTTTDTPASLALPHLDHHEVELKPRSHCFSTPPRLLLGKVSDHLLTFPILFLRWLFFSPVNYFSVLAALLLNWFCLISLFLLSFGGTLFYSPLTLLKINSVVWLVFLTW